MTRTEVFAYNLKDKVIINEVQRPGVVEVISIDYLGVQYRVSYWDNSERKSVWLPPEEISLR